MIITSKFSLLLYGFYHETNLVLFIFIFIFSLITIFSLLAIFYTNFFIIFFKKIYFFKNFNFDSLMEVRKNFISNIYFFLFVLIRFTASHTARLNLE